MTSIEDLRAYLTKAFSPLRPKTTTNFGMELRYLRTVEYDGGVQSAMDSSGQHVTSCEWHAGAESLLPKYACSTNAFAFGLCAKNLLMP